MDSNELIACIDVKLEIYDKRPDSLKFRSWTKCEVQIEAIKCFPCFFRITIKSLADPLARLIVSINVPGVNVSLATSRTKLYSYGLFWTNNRRDCFMYFAVETELLCRKHMKWLRKSIKMLEMYRQNVLEQRRNSRCGMEIRMLKVSNVPTLGPLPQIPSNTHLDGSFNNNAGSNSRISDIYEEIFEEAMPPPVTRRLSRSSIASGIYEEMKPVPSAHFKAILEERTPPPLPPPRKRLNTYESELAVTGVIQRSHTTPESEMYKKKKYRSLLDIFNAARSKRAESVNEKQACAMADLINEQKENQNENQFHNYANEEVWAAKSFLLESSKRHSFSSPDLSKINYLDTFDEEKLSEFLPLKSADDLSCNEWGQVVKENATTQLKIMKDRKESIESLNVSELLSLNFNCSAPNTSTMNLLGACGAVHNFHKDQQPHNIVMEDNLAGYCVMAPIRQTKPVPIITTAAASSSSTTSSSTTSGYSTGSYSPTTTSSVSNTNFTEVNVDANRELDKKMLEILANDYDVVPQPKSVLQTPNDSTLYENMLQASPVDSSATIRLYENIKTTPLVNRNFTGDLYENLLAVKAAQELEQSFEMNVCTSTPTDSADLKQCHDSVDSKEQEKQHTFYQTPRKSTISIDDKIPSYYPNSCDTKKIQRRPVTIVNNSPDYLKGSEKQKSFKNHLSVKNLLHIKIKRDRKDNIYVSSPMKIMDQRLKSLNPKDTEKILTTTDNKKLVKAEKISENVYTVNLRNNRKSFNSNNSNNKERNASKQCKENLDNELIFVKNIDFKFDDTATVLTKQQTQLQTSSGVENFRASETEYEEYYQASRNAVQLLNKFTTLKSMTSPPPLQPKLSSKLKSSSPASSLEEVTTAVQSKKFASLPRFKKFDLSPLKMKINNVLQRHQVVTTVPDTTQSQETE